MHAGMVASGIFPNSSAAKCIWHWERHFHWLRSQARHAGFTVADRNNLIRHKTSDTLFILGSGPSVNAIDSDGWNEIARHNSVGFNYFIVHPFVPTFYHMELRQHEIEMFRSCYSLRREAYRASRFLLNFHFLNYDNLKASDVAFIDDILVTVPRTYSEARPQDVPRIVHFTQNLLEPLDDHFLLHYRGSLCLMISMGLLLGYKKLVLIGVDLNNSGYFYCDERYACAETEMLRSSRCQPQISPAGALHATADPTFIPSTITIDRVLKLLNENVLKKRGVDLFVYSKDSLLHPYLPAWEDRSR